MARRKEITDEQILEAARAIFLTEGFSAQTAKIAERAGISEGTIFKRFLTKEALFFSALKVNREPAWLAQMEEQAGNGDIRENLLSLFLNILLFFHEMFPQVMVIFGTLRPTKMFEGIAEPPMIVIRRRIMRFLEGEMDRGRLRPCNMEFLSHVICGSLIDHIVQEIMTGQPLTPPQMHTIAEETLVLIWNGISPQ